MWNYLQILRLYYWLPGRAVGETLDRGSLGLALVLALVTGLALRTPGLVLERRMESALQEAFAAASNEKAGEYEAPGKLDAAAEARLVKRLQALAESNKGRGAVAPWLGFGPAAVFSELFFLAAVCVPLATGLVVRLEGRPRLWGVIQAEYGSLLLCFAMAWTAARLPVIPLLFFPVGGVGGWALTASTVYFLALAAFCLRTALGSRWGTAAGGAVGVGGVMLLGPLVQVGLPPMLYLLASPCLLYYLWGYVSAGAWRTGASVSSRQAFRRNIETNTINERDADAHYQLGLLQLQRHNFGEAEERFRKAAGIAPEDADYRFCLGKVLRQLGRNEEALTELLEAARLNDRTASSEVWREIGAARMALEQWTESLAALERYVERREYDPEGLVYLGEALAQSGRMVEARGMLERAVEAVQTMPGHRRGELKGWASRASAGLRRLGK